MRGGRRARGPSRDLTPANLSHRQRWALSALVWRFPHVHLGVGLAGNAMFVAGAVLFVLQHQGIGVWFFLAGSCGMFAGGLGEVARLLGKHRLARFDVDPFDPDLRWSRTRRRPSPLE